MVDKILVCLQGSCLVTGPSLLNTVPVGLCFHSSSSITQVWQIPDFTVGLYLLRQAIGLT